MKIRVVAGVGRSGTTWLARMLALSPTPMKVVMEPFARAAYPPDNGQIEPFSVLPGSLDVVWARDLLLSLEHSDDVIQEEAREWTVERDDPDAEVLLVKVTHSLPALPEILDGLDYKTIVTTRDTMRIIDSFFHGHKPEQRHYLVDEYKHLGLPWIENEVWRQAIVTEIVTDYLLAWALASERVKGVTFRDLCSVPVPSCKGLYRFLDLKWQVHKTDKTIMQMTTGNEEGYYDTSKNSWHILHQDYKFLRQDQAVDMVRML